MARIFISYRREDASGHAGRIYDRLCDEFGTEPIFMDVDAIAPGTDFVESIESAVSTADALVVVIGPEWMTAKDEHGERRLDDPKDFVRLEVGAALERKIRVIPVLVRSAAMPEEEDLPEPLARLAHLNALSITDTDWTHGVDRLVQALGPRVEPPPPTPSPTRLQLAAFPGALLVAIGVLVAHSTWFNVSFGSASRDATDLATAPAPIGFAIGALLAAGLALQKRTRAFGGGLLLGFGVAIGGRALGEMSAASGSGRTGWVIALLGALLLVVAALPALRLDEPIRARGLAPPAALAAAGGLGVLIALFVPFNEVQDEARRLLPNEKPGAYSQIATLLALALALYLLFQLPKAAFGSGLLLGLGVTSTLIWIRFAGVPRLEGQDIVDPQVGGLVGLAGAIAILVSALWTRSALKSAP